jgi:hypothetical protein
MRQPALQLTGSRQLTYQVAESLRDRYMLGRKMHFHLPASFSTKQVQGNLFGFAAAGKQGGYLFGQKPGHAKTGIFNQTGSRQPARFC